ncbi:hypothetical protein C5137_28475 [Bacillus cereus]|nr:hypothetical protein [Bacillus cereus]
MSSFLQTFENFLDIGPVFPAGIIIKIDQIEKFQDETKIVKYTGLPWKNYSLGQFIAENASLITSKKSIFT